MTIAFQSQCPQTIQANTIFLDNGESNQILYCTRLKSNMNSFQFQSQYNPKTFKWLFLLCVPLAIPLLNFQSPFKIDICELKGQPMHPIGGKHLVSCLSPQLIAEVLFTLDMTKWMTSECNILFQPRCDSESSLADTLSTTSRRPDVHTE